MLVVNYVLALMLVSVKPLNWNCRILIVLNSTLEGSEHFTITFSCDCPLCIMSSCDSKEQFQSDSELFCDMVYSFRKFINGIFSFAERGRPV